uniref:Uncharacterized protein n=1 Tax=Trichogramma kaykai TaxID=54128 RepID=A0ABD2WNV9_9HYME
MPQKPPVDQTDDAPEPIFDSKLIVEVMDLVIRTGELAMTHDPIMTRSSTFKHYCDLAAQIYEEMHKDILRRAKQTKLIDYLKN